MNAVRLLTLTTTTLWAIAAQCLALPTHAQQPTPTHRDEAAALERLFAHRFDAMRQHHPQPAGGGAFQQQQQQQQQPQLGDRSVYDPGVGDVADNFPLSAFIGANDDDDVGSDLAEADEDANGDGDVAAVDAELLQQLREHIREDEDIAAKSAMLLKLLDNSADGQAMPLIYVEDEPDAAPELLELADILPAAGQKRSGRYSRRYSYKRQNTRYHTYEPDQRYLCVPSRNDVLKLLMGLDEGRKGNTGRTVNFCNRKRPAKAIFSNIRFLG